VEKKAVVQVELGDEVQVVGESASDALDYEGAFTGENGKTADGNLGSPLCRPDEGAGRTRVSMSMKPQVGFVSTATLESLTHYPVVAVAPRVGAFGTAQGTPEHSQQPACFGPLLRCLVGGRASIHSHGQDGSAFCPRTISEHSTRGGAHRFWEASW
jgi:hypothetical protein